MESLDKDLELTEFIQSFVLNTEDTRISYTNQRPSYENSKNTMDKANLKSKNEMHSTYPYTGRGMQLSPLQQGNVFLPLMETIMELFKMSNPTDTPTM